ALDPDHRAAIRVAKIVKSVVVGQRVAADVVMSFGHADVACGTADDDGHLTLIVEEAATLRPNYRAAVPQHARPRLGEVVGDGARGRFELLEAISVGQVCAQNLARLDWRQMHCLTRSNPAPVGANEVVTVAKDFRYRAAEQHSPRLGQWHVSAAPPRSSRL